MRKTLYLLIGLISGAVVGATTALLLTPYSGEALQTRVRTRFQNLLDEGKQAAAARRVELRAQLENFKRGTPTPDQA